MQLVFFDKTAKKGEKSNKTHTENSNKNVTKSHIFSLLVKNNYFIAKYRGGNV